MLTQEKRENICEKLNNVVAGTYVLTIATQNCHWNVVGSLFEPVHKLCQANYEMMFEHIDVVAERARELQCYVVGTATDMIELNNKYVKVPVLRGGKMTVEEGLTGLLAGHEALIAYMRSELKVFEVDSVTQDIIHQKIEDQEKMAWMIRSSLGK